MPLVVENILFRSPLPRQRKRERVHEGVETMDIETMNIETKAKFIPLIHSAPANVSTVNGRNRSEIMTHGHEDS